MTMTPTASQVYQKLNAMIEEWEQVLQQFKDWQTSPADKVALKNPNGQIQEYTPLPQLINKLNLSLASDRGVLYYAEPMFDWPTNTAIDLVPVMATVTVYEAGEVLISMELEGAGYATVLSVDDVQIADFGDRDVDVQWWHFTVELTEGEHTIKLWSYRSDRGTARKILVTGLKGQVFDQHNQLRLKLSTIKHFDKSLLRDLPLNGGQQSSGTFQLTAKEEMYQVLNGQNSGSDSANPVPSILGDTCFVLPTEDSTNLSHSPHPLVTNRAIPVAAIRSTILNQPTDVPIFEPVKLSEYGMTSFRYIGEQPLYTILKGGVSLLRRVSNTDNTSVQMWLNLVPLSGLPSWEVNSLNKGIQSLGLSAASGEKPFNLFTEEFKDIFGYATPQMVTAVASQPEMNTGPVVNKWIPSNSTDLEVPEHPSANIPDPADYPNVKTTDWFPVVGGGFYLIGLIGGTSSRCRVHIQDASGTVSYAANISKTTSAEGLIRFPEKAVKARIYFSGYQDTAQNISVKLLPDDATYHHNVLGGKWVRKHIHVHRDVVFYPGVEYSFQWTTPWSDGTPVDRSSGYRYESGGFSCLFDATKILKAKRDQLMGE